MNKVLEVLKNARTLLSDPDHWTKGVLARDAAGDSIHTEQRTVYGVCWCLEGAVACEAYKLKNIRWDQVHLTHDAYSILRDVLNQDSIHKFNDNPYTTHPMVLEVLDKAIKSEEAN